MSYEWTYRTTGFLGNDLDIGPLSEDEFLHRVQQGELKRETLVTSASRTNGNWYYLSQIPGLMKALEEGERSREHERAAARKRQEEELRRTNEENSRMMALEAAAKAIPIPTPAPASDSELQNTSSTLGSDRSLISLEDKLLRVGWNSPDEAKRAIKELKLLKQDVSLQKRQAMEQMRIIRAEYTASVRAQGSKVRGGGFVGKVVRAVQTASRDYARAELANRLQPYESVRQRLENLKQQIESLILQIQTTVET